MKLKESLSTIYTRIKHKSSRDSSQSSVLNDFLPHHVLDNSEAIRELCYPDLTYLNNNYFQSFPVYIRMVNLAYHLGCRNVMEIGAGISTVLWSQYARRTGTRVHTLEADFAPMHHFVRNSPIKSLVANHVNCVQGITITCEDLTSFYGEPHDVIGGVDVSDFVDKIELFHKQDHIDWRRKAIDTMSQRKDWKICDLIVTEQIFDFPRPLVDLYSLNQSLDNELDFIRDAEARSEVGLLEKVIVNIGELDMVFFDSGELSSVIEWGKIKSKIAIGGVAAFHDIFFPKSFKNFIVCASL